MGAFAVLCGVGALGAVLVPGLGKFIAVGLGLLAAGAGIVAFRETGRRAGARLVGAAAAAIGAFALALGGAKIALTLVAVAHVARLAP